MYEFWLLSIPASSWYCHLCFLFWDVLFCFSQIGIQWHVTVVLISISSMTNNSEHFWCVFCPFKYLLYIYSKLMPTSYWVFCFLIIEFWEFFICSDSSVLSSMCPAYTICQHAVWLVFSFSYHLSRNRSF